MNNNNIEFQEYSPETVYSVSFVHTHTHTHIIILMAKLLLYVDCITTKRE
jgi:hypothetical protein